MLSYAATTRGRAGRWSGRSGVHVAPSARAARWCEAGRRRSGLEERRLLCWADARPRDAASVTAGGRRSTRGSHRRRRRSTVILGGDAAWSATLRRAPQREVGARAAPTRRRSSSVGAVRAPLDGSHAVASRRAAGGRRSSRRRPAARRATRLGARATRARASRGGAFAAGPRRRLPNCAVAPERRGGLRGLAGRAEYETRGGAGRRERRDDRRRRASGGPPRNRVVANGKAVEVGDQRKRPPRSDRGGARARAPLLRAREAPMSRPAAAAPRHRSSRTAAARWLARRGRRRARRPSARHHVCKTMTDTRRRASAQTARIAPTYSRTGGCPYGHRASSPTESRTCARDTVGVAPANPSPLRSRRARPAPPRHRGARHQRAAPADPRPTPGAPRRPPRRPAPPAPRAAPQDQPSLYKTKACRSRTSHRRAGRTAPGAASCTATSSRRSSWRC